VRKDVVKVLQFFFNNLDIQFSVFLGCVYISVGPSFLGEL
jgi:hypothetical protein